MTAPIRILDTGLMPARWNVALTAALAELHAKAAIGDTIRFHRYPACVLLGAGQDASLAADLAHCRQSGIAVVRRVTGGGAVYMSPAMLAWDVVVDRRACGDAFDAMARRVCGGVAAGLSRLGVSARFRPPHDIAIAGRKVSGSGGYASGRSAVLQGTVLLAEETGAMARALRLPEAAVRERTTCLEVEIGAVPSLASVRAAVTEGLTGALDCNPVSGRLHRAELASCEALLRDEIGADGHAVAHTAAPA
jgi:lipoate---protein ligase